MNYTINLSLNGDSIEYLNRFIPKSQKLTLLLKTNDSTIQNIKLLSGDSANYMVREAGGFMLRLDPNMAHIGKNTFVFVLEKRLPNRKTITEVECQPLDIDLTDGNISNPVEDNLERLQNEISKIIYHMV